MRGDGHTAYGGNSPCIDPAVDAYLKRRTLPPVGTVCKQQVPFAASAAAASGSGGQSRLLRRLAPRVAPMVGGR
jgi:hypothetical protein